LSEKARAGFIKAQDVCNIIVGNKFQNLFLQVGICKCSISLSMAQQWLAKLKWCYHEVKKGMYIDGHERDDIVAYQQAFIYRWAEYEMGFQFWDNSDNPIHLPPNCHPLILVTHNKSMFFQNDERKTC